MKQNIIFTNEAQKLFDKYMDELKSELDNANISMIEKNDTINDIRSQIIELSNFKEEVIGTDTLKHVISKIGTPKEILSALVNEVNFIDDVENNNGSTKTIDFTARQVAKLASDLYTSIFIITLFILISSFFGQEILIVFVLMNIINIILVIAYVLIINYLDYYKQLANNSYLLANIRPDYKFIGSIISVIILNIVVSSFVEVDSILFFFFAISHLSMGILYIKLMYNNRASYIQ